MPRCKVDDCGREAVRWKLTTCESHYYRMRKYGTFEGPALEPARTCIVEACESVASRTGRTLCEKHYYRLRRTGTTEILVRERVRAPRPPCKAEGCNREARTTKGRHCSMHERRVERTGRVEGKGRAPEHCIVAGCVNPAKTIAGHCGMHNERVRNHGSPDVVLRSNWTGADATYAAVHLRLRAVRGNASEHRCVDCRGHARQWSYNHSGGPGHRDREPGPYNVDLATYEPRCVSCHKKFDLAHLGTNPSKENT